MPIIDLESNISIKELLADSRDGQIDIDPNPYFQRFALNTSLTLNYGIRIDGSIDNELLKEVVHVERVVSNLRSTSNNWQDYIPLLRLWPSRDSQAGEYRIRRDKYLTLLLDKLKEKIARGEDKPCITGNILKDPEAKLSEGKFRPEPSMRLQERANTPQLRSSPSVLQWFPLASTPYPATLSWALPTSPHHTAKRSSSVHTTTS